LTLIGLATVDPADSGLRTTDRSVGHIRLISRSFGSVEGMLTVHPLQHRHNTTLCADQTWLSMSVVNLDHAVFRRPQAVIANGTRTAGCQDGDNAMAVLFAQWIRIMLHHSAPPPASLTALNTVDLLTPIDLATAEIDVPAANRLLAWFVLSPKK
jgi:hypothetical protein